MTDTCFLLVNFIIFPPRPYHHHAQSSPVTTKKDQKAIGVVKVNETGDPDILTQIVRGSEPTFSVVNPWVFVTEPGTVTGIVTAQMLLVVVNVTPVIVLPLVVHVRLGAQASLAMRLLN